MAYFLPIKSTSLAHYFVCACVKPTRYFENKPQDIQDRFRNLILLSSELGTSDTDCCIELVLTKDEERRLIPCGKEFFLLPTPLPISRVKTIYFREQRQLEQTLSNINMSAAFIPYHIAKVTKFSNVAFNVDYIDEKLPDMDCAHQLEMFDRILGALALMKVAKESYMNFSENYASTLSFFNACIKQDMERQGLRINNKFFGLFTRNDSFSKYLHYLEKRISKDDLDKIAVDNNQSLERSISKLVKTEKLTGAPYIFAILQSYGVGDEAATLKIDSLIINNFKDIKDGMAEATAFYYGYNRGYSVFNNFYGTEETRKQNVKYRLDSQLDYYTIESVYQFAFYGNTTSSQFPYIDAWCPRKNQRPRRKTDYMILDTAFIGKKKPSVFSKDYLQGLLAEVKALDIINITLASFVDKIRNIVALDAKEEIEDSVDDRIEILNKEIERLKTKDTPPPAYIEGEDKLQQNLEKESESKLREPEFNSLSNEYRQIRDDLGSVEDYPENKKPRKSKKLSSKSKSESKPTKRSKKKTYSEGTLDLPFE